MLQLETPKPIQANPATQKIKVHWVRPGRLHVANAFGYSFHNKMMREYGSEFLEYDDNSKLALHIVSADHYVPIPGKVNVLFTMWEFLDVPPVYILGLLNSDAVIVPCNFCKEIFQKYTPKPIYVCPEGINPDHFQFHERSPRIKGKFRFLWIGAPNPRKGYPLILELIKIFGSNPDVEFYLQTTFPKTQMEEFRKKLFADWRAVVSNERNRRAAISMYKTLRDQKLHSGFMVYGQNKNIILDSRVYANKDLASLYNAAHCFVLPSLGEGWGLTLCEAMATGLPCIAPPHTGMADYFNADVGFPVKYRIEELDLQENYKVKARAYIPDSKSLIEQMIKVTSDYQYALRKGRRASEKIRTLFTWKRSARKLAEILKDIQRRFL